MSREIPKAYEPHEIEERWAKYWFDEKLFRADVNDPRPAWSIVIPPPNVTGSLHMGHMMDHTEIDILTRWHRMSGDNTLFLPGTDHAGISTQRVVVRLLQAEGIDYRKLGREEFEKRVWKWKEESGGTITKQMVKIGDSCDWSRERFTLDPGLSRAVREAFVRLYEENLIYRGHYLVNWCPRCLTAISDLETVHTERAGKLWHIRYPIVGTKDFLVVATTRPETMLGDTAVAVHPEDERYQKFIGKKVMLPLMNREIPVIADTYVEREFGTGVLKITPAHDPNDFEVGKRHKLPEIDVMTDDAHMNEAAGRYAGLDRFEAREKIVADLQAAGLLEKVVEHTHAIGACDRCGTIVEPRASTQWFVKMKQLAEPAIEAVETGKIAVIPENWKAVYFEWMRNIRDWCISRQLWWGHRIPAWHCAECEKISVARENPANCAYCGSSKIEQDPDVLDTWFSSALWPFSTLGWPEKTADLAKYYPTSTLITGRDILFFWAARMIMMGLKFTGTVPFRQLYLHSLVLNAEGQKMSKSKGTGLDPLELMPKYGTDALRFCLASMAAPGSDIILGEDKLMSARAFANKIWNAARFLFVNLEKFEAGGVKLEELAAPEIREKAPYAPGGAPGAPSAGLPLIDQWIFSRLARVSEDVNTALGEFRFHEAAQVIYHFFWGDFCDWYIEWIKPQLAASDHDAAIASWRNLFAVLDAALRLLHPFMPFITEELWHRIPQRDGNKSIALQPFPKANPAWANAGADQQFALLQDVITAARNIRGELKLEPRKKVAADFSTADAAIGDLVRRNEEAILRLAALSALHISSGPLDSKAGVIRSTAQFDVRIAYGEGVDNEAELARVRKEIDRLEKDIESKKKRLADEAFRSRAPLNIRQNLEATLAEREAELKKARERLGQLG
ncbi:MAG: valine--tRNA ligase [Candidatus Acidiferrales bacterium]